MNPLLKNHFADARRKQWKFWNNGHRDRATWSTPPLFIQPDFAPTAPPAIRAMATARTRYADGVASYTDSTFPASYATPQAAGNHVRYVTNPASFGLREIGAVEVDVGGWRCREFWQTGNRRNGWYTDEENASTRDGSGLMWGVVFQMTARNGVTRFVPGYQNGDESGAGVTVDLGDVESFSTRDEYMSPLDNPAARDAARTADHMAQTAAENEREWRRASNAGNHYADARAAVHSARRELLAILKDARPYRRPRLGGSMSPHLCKAIADTAARLRAVIRTERQNMADYASGWRDGFEWNSNDSNLRQTFEESAGI